MNPIHPTLFTRLRALPRPAWILFLGTFLNKFGTFVLPFLTLYLTRRGFTLTDAGLAMSAYGLGSLMASGLGGCLADTIGRRKTIVLSMFSVALAMMMLSQSRSLTAIVAATWFAALTGELYRPASSALLADLVPPELRVTAFSAYRMAFNAGFAFGPATAGFLAERGYFWLFAGDAATSVLFGVIALALLPRGVQGRQEEGGWMGDLKTLTSDREFHRVLAGAFIIGLVFLQISSTFSLHITRLGYSAATYGMILSLNGVLVTICELPMSSLTCRFRPWHMMALGYVLIAVGFAGNAFAHTVPALLACVIIFTFGEMATFPVSSAYIAGLAPAHLRGRYMGVYALVWSAGLIAAPQIGLPLFAVGPKTLWLTCGVMGLVAAGIAFHGPVKRKSAIPAQRQKEGLVEERS